MLLIQVKSGGSAATERFTAAGSGQPRPEFVQAMCGYLSECAAFQEDSGESGHSIHRVVLYFPDSTVN